MSFNVFNAEFGSHNCPSMNDDQRLAADRWALPAGLSVIALFVALILTKVNVLGSVPEVVHVAIIGFWMVEMVTLLRLTPDNKEWFSMNKLDLAAIIVGVATLPVMPLWLAGFAPLAAGMRAFDCFAVFTRYWRITPFRFFVLCYILALTVGALSFSQLEIIPDGGQPTLLQGFYWAAVTLASVGYGDLSAHTTEAMVLCIMFIPMTFVLIPLAFWSLQSVLDREASDLEAISERHKPGRNKVFQAFDKQIIPLTVGQKVTAVADTVEEIEDDVEANAETSRDNAEELREIRELLESLVASRPTA